MEADDPGVITRCLLRSLLVDGRHEIYDCKPCIDIKPDKHHIYRNFCSILPEREDVEKQDHRSLPCHAGDYLRFLQMIIFQTSQQTMKIYPISGAIVTVNIGRITLPAVNSRSTIPVDQCRGEACLARAWHTIHYNPGSPII